MYLFLLIIAFHFSFEESCLPLLDLSGVVCMELTLYSSLHEWAHSRVLASQSLPLH